MHTGTGPWVRFTVKIRERYHAPAASLPRAQTAFTFLRRNCCGAIGATVLCVFTLPGEHAFAAEQVAEQRSTYGELGLLDMPGAHMAKDGELSATAFAFNDLQRVTLGFQILPWLEGTFRYTRIARYSSTGFETYDRSFGLKMRLLQETRFLPDVSVGIRDLVGTGIFGAEYLVASKQFGPLDVTAGIGWGRLAGNGTLRNPFGAIAPSFDTRTGPTGLGGKVDFGQFFHGPDAGVFGGITWRTPVKGLSLTAEYSSDRYKSESASGAFTYRSPANFGITYSPWNWTAIALGWFYGSTFGGTLSFTIDPTKAPSTSKIGPPPPAPVPRTDAEQLRAVAAFVEDRTQRTRPTPAKSHALQSASAFVDTITANATLRIATAEVDGNTLLVQAHSSASGLHLCHSLAENVRQALVDVDTVVIDNLDRPTDAANICAVQRVASATPVPFTMAHPEPPPAPPQKKMRSLYDLAGDVHYTWPGDAPVDPTRNVADRIRTEADAQGLQIEAVIFRPHELTVHYTNTKYYVEDDAINRLLRVLMADAPADIEMFRIVMESGGITQRAVAFERAPLERMFATRGSAMEIEHAIAFEAPPSREPAHAVESFGSYPRFNWALLPNLRQSLFDPNSPIQIDVVGVAQASLELFKGFDISTQLEADIYNTYTFKRPSNSVLPHVRSDAQNYVQDGGTGIASLDVSYRTRIAKGVFVEARAGYLEDMFAGAGGQILWRPDNARWAIGADIYQVWQRNFDRLFGVQNYNVTTGHVSLYYKSPWYGLNFNVHAGRYLAGDNGATFEVLRTFDTGVQVGAFATFTDVPFSKFGEGSFDKGIMLRIPFDWALPVETQAEYNLTLRPLTRDGGQRLDNDNSLYYETERTSYGAIAGNLDRISDH